MRTIDSGLKIFQSVKGYFTADHRILHYIEANKDLWDRASVAAKFGALDLNKHIPDIKLNEVHTRFLQDDVKTGICVRDLSLFNLLCNDLRYLREVKYVVSYLLCAHDPHFFPIWDHRRNLIHEWETLGEVNFYDDLKLRIDQYRSENGCKGLHYFMFNKLLWLCE
ncbi:MAG: hypothetical protein CMB80_16860 [Flammeovirgaceae bacterium]|nr:hypothetical protein [Flammeovirgaceae bacterium]MBE63042.1 hypothetical protein [Flammeovirgaceae bacterium]MBR07690.1 hypothetical protein [Rickettsiales bacterium]|tara:strand:- start:171 stop:668 length:498 start_codon:yes stop_codon:yes gene_type:complete